MGFSPHLSLLIFAPAFLDFSLAIDRTSWSHVCGGGAYQQLKSCDYRKKAIESLKNITTTANIVISPAQVNPPTECWASIYYKFRRNRTEERFKEHIERSLGSNLQEYIAKMTEAVNNIVKHDHTASSLLEKLEDWRKCAVEQKGEETCQYKASVLTQMDLSEVPPKFGNDTVDLRNAIARLSHLQHHNLLRTSAAQLINAFHTSVTNAHQEVVDKTIRESNWCEAGSDKPDVFETDFPAVLNKEAISMFRDFQEIDQIDQRTVEYFKHLEEFRSCETIRGRYDLNCAEIRIKADKIDPKDMALDENNAKLAEIDRPAAMDEKKEKPRKLIYPSVGFLRPVLGPIHVKTRVYEKETENTLSEFFNGVKNTVASKTDEIIKSAVSLFEKAKSSPNCEKFIRESTIVNDANELSLIHNITQDIMRFRSKFEQYVTEEDKYVDCVEKHLYSETEETVKATCNEAALINERKKLLAIVNAASIHEALARHRRFFPHTAVSADKALLGNQIWAGSWGNLQSKMDDMKAIGDHAWLTASAAPSKLIQELSSSAQCEAELYDGKFQAGSPDLNKFDESWKNTLASFDKLHHRMEKEFAIYELLTKLAVCSDENEFSCYYLNKKIENLLA